jgi:hypothetical protein
LGYDKNREKPGPVFAEFDIENVFDVKIDEDDFKRVC